MVETVSLNSGKLMFVLLDNLLQSAVQILLLLLKKLLFLDKRKTEIINDTRKQVQALISRVYNKLTKPQPETH